MAELNTSEGHKKGKKKKGAKKISLRVDLTPMVDLGFLLVTFFMLASTFSKPQTMEINMPVKPKGGVEIEEPNAVKASKALTILIDAENKIYWYQGVPDVNETDLGVTDFSQGGIRKVLQQKNKTVKDMVVLIKPTDDATYKNTVDILDEMNISNIKRYAIVDVTPLDLDLIATKK